MFKSKKILVVDDEKDLREIIKEILSFHGATVILAENSRDAASIIQNQTLDAIVSDIQMPNGDGVTLLSAVRSLHRTEPPFIIITGQSKYSTEDLMSRGAAAVIEKPFASDHFVKTIAKSIALSKTKSHRAFPRFASQLRAWIQESGAENSVEVLVTTVSYNGMFAVLPNAANPRMMPAVNDTIRFEFSKSAQGQAICRCHKILNEKNQYGIGLEFTTIDPEVLDIVQSAEH